MRLSQLFVRTLRDDPADAEMPSHRLLLRAGYVRPLGSGVYSLLPLGVRVAQRIEPITPAGMRAGGCRAPPAPAARRARRPAGVGDLLAAAARLPRRKTDRADHPRGDGRDRLP